MKLAWPVGSQGGVVDVASTPTLCCVHTFERGFNSCGNDLGGRFPGFVHAPPLPTLYQGRGQGCNIGLVGQIGKERRGRRVKIRRVNVFGFSRNGYRRFEYLKYGVKRRDVARGRKISREQNRREDVHLGVGARAIIDITTRGY